MPLYLQERQIAIWKFLPNLSAADNIKIALTKMACFRQATIDKTTLESYTLALKDLDLRAFQVAMAIISESHRREGETAFPDLGYILDVMDEAREIFPKRGMALNTSPVVAGKKSLENG